MIRFIFVVIAISQSAYVFAQHDMWGTAEGGSHNLGVLFRTANDGSGLEVMKNFQSTAPGRKPFNGRLLQATSGKLYGLTLNGGDNDSGVLFEYDPTTEDYILKHDFDENTGTFPCGSLIQAADGKLYGMTFQGGTNSLGVIFQYDISNNSYNVIYNFDGTNGGAPLGDLLEAEDGKLYGMTSQGGVNSLGVIFEFDLSDFSYTKRYDFDLTTGAFPAGSLTQMNGKFYGMTSAGGPDGNDFGVLFEFDPSTGEYIDKHDFDDTNGRSSRGNLIVVQDKLYGLTYYGGTNSSGIIFSYDPALNDFKKLHDFGDAQTSDGVGPKGSLFLSLSGKLYGNTSEGGLYGGGILFVFDPNTQTYSSIYNFKEDVGDKPSGSLIELQANSFYGMTSSGGKAGGGTIFAFTASMPRSVFTTKIDFSFAPEGINPSGHPIQASDSKLYGMTHDGGINNSGTLYQYDLSTNLYVKKIDFSLAGGSQPSGSLIESEGKLYGLTSRGGVASAGVLFEYDLSEETYHSYDFDGSNGAYPLANLIKGGNGKLYGLAYVGGSLLQGALFEFDPATGNLISKYDFDGANGRYPFGSLVLAKNGMMYGLTKQGGNSDAGVLFEYDPVNNLFAKKHDFEIPTGSWPTGSLMEKDGKLYGVTSNGGANFNGVIFEYDYSNVTYSKKYDFVTGSGANPAGTLVIGTDGNLYGLASTGGDNDMGTLFKYEPTNASFTKKFSFDGINGKSPLFDLMVLNTPPQITQNIGEQMALQLSPFSFTFDSNTFNDTDGDNIIYSATGASSSSLPSWLTFDANTRTFSGTPGRSDHSTTILLSASDPFGASTNLDFTIQVGVITSVEPTPDKIFSVFPNPVNDKLNIVPDEPLEGSIVIRSVMGEELMTVPIMEKSEIDLSALDPGLYFVECKTRDKSYQVKIIKR